MQDTPVIKRGYFTVTVERAHNRLAVTSAGGDWQLFVTAEAGERVARLRLDTPPSDFRDQDADRPTDALEIEIDADYGLSLGPFGAHHDESITITCDTEAILFVTVIADDGASVAMVC